jgi:hypothetical protein
MTLYTTFPKCTAYLRATSLHIGDSSRPHSSIWLISVNEKGFVRLHERLNTLSPGIWSHVVRLQINRHFGAQVCLPPASGLFLAWHILRPWKLRQHDPPKRLLTFNGLHSYISQQTEVFITISVWISDRARKINSPNLSCWPEIRGTFC